VNSKKKECNRNKWHTYHAKKHLFKMGLVNSPKCNGCKQASDTTSHSLCDCEALATLRFRHIGCLLRDNVISKNHSQQDTALCSECRTAE